MTTKYDRVIKALEKERNNKLVYVTCDADRYYNARIRAEYEDKISILRDIARLVTALVVLVLIVSIRVLT
jgi:hypothetical protein